ncbi:MAG: SMP-30/gluconolactonase/LRE family protein [Gammaproteobacteria bacterium]
MNRLKTQKLADGFVFLEGPRWHGGKLWFSDMWGFKVYTLTEAGERAVVCDVPQRPSGLGFLPDGTLLIVSMADRKLLKLTGGKLVVHADLAALAGGDVNDSVTDAQGRTYVGNFGYDLFGGAEPRLADLVLVDAQGAARVVAHELNFPNGSVIKDGGRTLVVAESWAGRLAAFDIAVDGSLSNRRVYASLGERIPDGICLDAEGGIWVSSFNSGEFLRVLDGGQITDVVECGDKRAVACQLGGADGRTLFCLTYDGQIEDLHQQKAAGAIETVRVAVGGAGSP